MFEEFMNELFRNRKVVITGAVKNDFLRPILNGTIKFKTAQKGLQNANLLKMPYIYIGFVLIRP